MSGGPIVTMSSPEQADGLALRYAQATRALPIPALARIVGNILEGYWLDDRRYFYLAQSAAAATGRVVETPSLIDVQTGAIRTLIERGPLERLLVAAGVADDPAILDRAVIELPTESQLAVTAGGRHCLIDLGRGEVTATLDASSSPEVQAPNGALACYVHGDDLWLRDRRTGATRPLTSDGAHHHAYGQQPENALAPIAYRANPAPCAAFSPDSRWLLTHRIDERGLPGTAIVQHAPAEGERPRVHEFKLSVHGDPLPTLELIAIDLRTGRRVVSSRFDLHAFPPLAMQSAWFANEDRVCWLVRDRGSRTVELRELDLATGAERTLVGESAERGYVECAPIFGQQPNVFRLVDSDEVLWWSDRDGNGHLYLYHVGNGRERQLTAGPWHVRAIVRVDAAARRVLFTAGGRHAGRDPGLRTLMQVGLDGGEPEVVLDDAGDVAVAIDALLPDQSSRYRPASARRGVNADASWCAVRRSSATGGSRTDLIRIGQRRTIAIAATTPDDRPVPRALQLVAADGHTPLHGLLFLPRDFDARLCYPLLDFIYPGPQMPWLPRTCATRAAQLAQAWAELGLAVLLMDTRGMPLRERALRQACDGELYEPQLADHVAALAQIRESHAFVDPRRAGMIGVSGGAAATVRALCTYPDAYVAGVAINGNHDSRLFRSLWLDVYGTAEPARDPARHSNATYVQDLRAALLLVCGDMDDNVPMAQTIGLVRALSAANRDYELLVAPNEGHVSAVTNDYAQRRIWDFLVRELRGLEPPLRYAIATDPGDLPAFERAVAREFAL